jgi:hypothetical protein
VNTVSTKRGGIAVLLAAMAFGYAGSAKADSATVTLTGVNGNYVGNVYTSPYFATIDDTTTGVTTNGVPIVCDDFLHNVYMGETWTASINPLSDLGALRFGSVPNAAQLYDDAAYLTDTYILSSTATVGQQEAASFAVWALFAPISSPPTPSILSEDPGAAYLFGPGGAAQTMLTTVEGMTFAAGAYSNYEVITPTSGSPDSAQEYLVRTPEPSTLLLLCAGLMGLMIMARRRNLVPAAQK